MVRSGLPWKLFASFTRQLDQAIRHDDGDTIANLMARLELTADALLSAERLVHVATKPTSLRALLESNIDIMISLDKHLPLQIAIANGFVDVDDLRKRIWPNLRGIDGAREALRVACENGSVDSVCLFLEHGVPANASSGDGEPLLYRACENGHTDIARLLVQNGADVNWATSWGFSLLLVQCQNGHLDIVRVLLEHGADVNKAGNGGWTPIHAACLYGHLGAVRLLLDHGADVNKAEDLHGQSPLFYACKGGHVDVVRLLLERGADVNKADHRGETPLVAACTRHDKATDSEDCVAIRAVELELRSLLKRHGAVTGKRNERPSASLTNLFSPLTDKSSSLSSIRTPTR